MGEAPRSQAALLDAIDAAMLTPLVRRALNSTTAEVTSWGHKRIGGGFGPGTAVYRFSGGGVDQDRAVLWSLILKELCPVREGFRVTASTNYRREAEVYQSGWLDDLPGNLLAPQCYCVTDHPDGTCWIWLEDITDDIGPHWPLEHYGTVARHLGQFNGTYLVDRPLPSFPWLHKGGFQATAAGAAAAMPVLRNSLEHPLIRRWFPGDTSDGLFRVWTELDSFLETLGQLPHTVCHQDTFRRNLFARRTAEGNYRTVAIDWSDPGWNAVGFEINTLVVGGVLFFEVDFARVRELEDVAFEGYLEGLRDAGWRGDPREVRLGYAASSLRYYLGSTAGTLPMVLDENLHGYLEQGLGRPIEECCDHWARVGSYLSALIDEARELMDILE